MRPWFLQRWIDQWLNQRRRAKLRGRRPKPRRAQLQVECLEKREVPTIAIGANTYSSLADAVTAASSGQTITIDTSGMPTGGYTGGVTIDKSLTISGSSGVIIASPTSSGGLTTDDAILEISGSVTVNLDDLTLDGTAGYSTNLAYGIYANDSANLTLTSDTIQNIANASVTGAQDGVGLVDAAVTGSGCTVSNNYGVGVYSTGTGGLAFEDSTFDDNDIGLEEYNAGDDPNGVDGSTFENNTAYGILLQDSAGSIAMITNNSVSGSDYDIAITRGSSVSSQVAFDIEQNTIGDAASAGLYFESSGTTEVPSGNVNYNRILNGAVVDNETTQGLDFTD
ncbi:MAG: right-handed parallel beta-helix repeat-containing protein, partial [Gemmataceae bacterium]